jgi:hypothetical protein
MPREDRPPESYLIPIEGLRVPRSWQVGRALIHPGTLGEQLIKDAPPFGTTANSMGGQVLRILRSASDSSIGELRGVDDPEEAVDALRSSLDALRLFQLSRSWTETTSFGLPGDLYQSRIEYVTKWDRSAPGWHFRGDHPGWEFTASDIDEWSQSPAFQFLSEALQDPDANEGARRAVIGTQLFSRAAIEHRRDLKMLGVAAALEAWLLRRQPGAQTLRLARHVSWFGCGRHDNNLCGRDRPICPYLHLSPDQPKDRHRLSTLRDLGNTHVRWRCSEWHRVMDWYDSRSGAAHGDPTAVDAKEADSAEFWIAHYLAPPILDWLRTHSLDPVGELERELGLVTQPQRWDEMLDALDSAEPPARPPLA